MGGYLLNRMLQSLIVIFLISIISFALIHAAPGDPTIAIYGPRVQELRPADRERIRENLGLNRPLPVQYAKWLERVMHGDLGYSYRTGLPVWNSIVEKVPATFLLAGTSILLILLLSIILGVLTGIRRDSWLDHLTTIMSLTLVSTPNFWLALMLILIFGVWLGWLPTSGMSTIDRGMTGVDVLRHLILPAAVLAFSHIGYYIRFVRASVWEQSQLDYVWAMRARGIREQTILFKHVLKNSLLPFVNYLGVTIPVMLSGAVVVEAVFAWPGLGQFSVEAATTRDYSVLMGTILMAGIVVVMGNFLADVVCMYLDPRVAAGQLGKEVKA